MSPSPALMRAGRSRANQDCSTVQVRVFLIDLFQGDGPSLTNLCPSGKVLNKLPCCLNGLSSRAGHPCHRSGCFILPHHSIARATDKGQSELVAWVCDAIFLLKSGGQAQTVASRRRRASIGKIRKSCRKYVDSCKTGVAPRSRILAYETKM